jgi:hypothetical protein
MALDVYAWLAQRLWRVPAGRGQLVSWDLLKEQFGFAFGRMDNFKACFRGVLRRFTANY